MITRTFLKGLAAVVPIALTIYLLYWLGTTAETLFGGVLSRVLPDVNFPGMGVVAGLVVVFAAGVLLNLWLPSVLFRWGQSLLEHIPFVKTLYGSLRDLTRFFYSDEDDAAKQTTVMVELGEPPVRVLGFLTRESFDDLPAGLGSEGEVAVYIPMSYQIGGFTVLVPRSRVQPLDMSVEEAMRFAVTAGVSTKKVAPAPKGAAP